MRIPSTSLFKRAFSSNVFSFLMSKVESAILFAKKTTFAHLQEMFPCKLLPANLMSVGLVLSMYNKLNMVLEVGELEGGVAVMYCNV